MPKIKNELKNLPKWQLGYIAGIIDGEGSLGIYKTHSSYEGTVRVSNSSHLMIALLASTLRLGAIRKQKLVPKRKQLWEWRVCDCGDIYVLLSSISKYMIVKKPQAELLIEFCSHRVQKHHDFVGECYIKMKTLNDFGGGKHA